MLVLEATCEQRRLTSFMLRDSLINARDFLTTCKRIKLSLLHQVFESDVEVASFLFVKKLSFVWNNLDRDELS